MQKQNCDTLLTTLRPKEKNDWTQTENQDEHTQGLHIMIASDTNYLYPALVLLTSLFHNHYNHTVVVYFLQSGLSNQEQHLLQSMTKKWKKKEIKCIEVTEESLQGLRGFGRFSVAAFYRILGMDMVPEHVKRILYLDVDMVINKDLSELFTMRMNEPLAACYDINNELRGNIEYHKSVVGIAPGKEHPYFNSGMLVLDMEYIRKYHVKESLLQDIAENFETYTLVDQDALNHYYVNKTLYLPWQKYNCPCVPFLITDKETENFCSESFLLYQEVCTRLEERKNTFDVTNKMMQNASIIHFCTPKKPWQDREFYNANSMTAARTIYKRYEQLLQRILPKEEQYLFDNIK